MCCFHMMHAISFFTSTMLAKATSFSYLNADKTLDILTSHTQPFNTYISQFLNADLDAKLKRWMHANLSLHTVESHTT